MWCRVAAILLLAVAVDSCGYSGRYDDYYDNLRSSKVNVRLRRDVTLGDRLNCTEGSQWPANRVNTTDRLTALREQMANKDIQIYIIPTDDEHQSEYVAEYDKRRQWISGLSGSAGTAVVTPLEAALWTDGRYFLQADQELDCNWLLMKSGLDGVPTMIEWIQSVMGERDIVSSDPKLISAVTWESWKESFGSKLEPQEENLIDNIWRVEGGRPPRSNVTAFVLGLTYAGKSWPDKVDELRAEVSQQESDAIVLTAMDEVGWLFNLRGYDVPYTPVFRSYVVMESHSGGDVILYIPEDKLTDEVRHHLTTNCADKCVDIRKYELIYDELESLVNNSDWKTVILPQKYSYSGGASYSIYSKVPESARKVVPSPVVFMKARKNSVEVSGMKAAHVRDAVALCKMLAQLEKEVPDGVYWDELKVMETLTGYRKEQQSYGDSFETISAFGSNGAVIHYKANNITNKQINTESLFLLDSGGQYLDGTTDVTRTMHYGTPTDFQRDAYTRVLMGAIDLALAHFPKGTEDTDVDILARSHLYDIGLNYRHGTGHGIGAFLNIHEAPIQVRIYSKESHKFEPGQFFSDEPGYYEDGEFGIRLETIITVVEKNTTFQFDGIYMGFEPVTLVPFEPKLIKVELLNEEQVEWLNAYHQNVRDVTGAALQDQGFSDVYEWMMSKTEPVTFKYNTAVIINPSSWTIVVTLLFLMFK